MSARPTPAPADIEVAGSPEEAASEALVLSRGHVSEIDAPITGGEMAVLYRLGRGLAASGMFKDARQADQAFAKLIFGRDLGLSATQAMTDIHIIEGKPEMSANLQASKVKASGRYDYTVDELTPERCQLSFYELARAPMAMRATRELLGVSEFTIEDAQRAGLVKDKSPWVKYPRNMLFARAMSNGVAWYCPDVMNGIRVYAEGELADVQRAEQQTPAVTADGSPLEAQGAGVDPEPEDATVVQDRMLTDQERNEIVAAFDAAGAKIEMFLTAVGVESTDDLSEASAFKLREKLGEHLQRTDGGAS
jgi:hypothetical protein